MDPLGLPRTRGRLGHRLAWSTSAIVLFRASTLVALVGPGAGCGRIGYGLVVPLATGGAGTGGNDGGGAGGDGAGAGDAQTADAGGDTGTNDGGPSDAGPTDAGSSSCADAGPPCGVIKLQYRVPNQDQSVGAWGRPHLNLINTGSENVPLEQLTVRYWFTEETPQPQTLACDSASIGCPNITGAFSAVIPPRAGADEVLVVGFLPAAGTLAAAGQTQEMGLRFGKSDFSNYDQTNDYSYDGSLASLTDYPKITLYRNGVLVWGTEPP